MNTKQAIDDAVRVLLLSGKRVPPGTWQGVSSPNEMFEVENIFITMEMTSVKSDLAKQTKADLPWAEDHFKERISGNPTNPGKTYKDWPYYRGVDNDALFRNEGVFSHTYQERFWPNKEKAIRYYPGDYKDLIDVFKGDPNTRQCFLSIWHPEDQSPGRRRRPCSIGYWFKKSRDILNVTYLIRSCDAARHFRNDVYMAQRLAMDFALRVSTKAGINSLGTLSMWIGSFHRFDQDKYKLKKQLDD